MIYHVPLHLSGSLAPTPGGFSSVRRRRVLLLLGARHHLLLVALDAGVEEADELGQVLRRAHEGEGVDHPHGVQIRLVACRAGLLQRAGCLLCRSMVPI